MHFSHSSPALLSALSTTLLALGSGPQDVVPGDVHRHLPAELRNQFELHDPFSDDWETESFERRVKKALTPLRACFQEGGDFEQVLGKIFESSPRATDLVPEDLSTTGDASTVTIHRADGLPGETSPVEISDLVAGMQRWRSRYSEVSGLDLKIVSVVGAEEDWQTTVRWTSRGRAEDTRLQHNVQWHLSWAGPGTLAAPRAVEVRVEQFEEVRLAPGAPHFVDHTAEVFGDGDLYATQLRPGIGHWQRRIDASLGLGTLGHEGLAVGDVNGDGLEDVYLCQPGGLPNRLFLRQPDGIVQENSRAAGLDLLDPTISALIVDLDGDGHRDLVTAHVDIVAFFKNDGKGTFEHALSIPAATTMSLAAADFDGDGDLDVYACGYHSPYSDLGAPLPYHDANNGERNQLLRNEGQFRFLDVTEAVGLEQNNLRFSFAASWEDYDNDGDPDLYVANDFGRNNLYRNDGGRFVDVAAAAGVEDVSAGMGVTWGDTDRDGFFDLYVSNMYSSAGSRVAYQRRFQSTVDQETLGLFRRHARGNSLFRNTGGAAFEDITLNQGVEMGRWAWGSIFTDFTNNGWLDLFIPNGFATGDRKDDL